MSCTEFVFRVLRPVLGLQPAVGRAAAAGGSAGPCGSGADLGPQAVEALGDAVKTCRTLIWNGPLGAFETRPFDAATMSLARTVAALTADGSLLSVAGGGDTVAALNAAGVAGDFSFVSTAGGAFLEWLEGKKLPGVMVLMKTVKTKSRAAR